MAKRRWKLFWLMTLLLPVFAWGRFHYLFYRLDREIRQLRSADTRTPGYHDLKGVIHVHTAAGGQSQGTLDEVVEAAQAVHADFVVVTEHLRRHAYQSRYAQRPGERPILIFGEEREEETRRVLVIPFQDSAEELRIATHWMAAPREPVMEIVNLHDEADSVSRLYAGLALAGSLPGYSKYFLFALQGAFRERLRHWDDILKQRRLWIVGGNDAHASVGLRLEYSGGKALLDWTVDPYRSSFAYLNTHVLLPQAIPEADAILKALAGGLSYVSFDFLHDPRGFSFAAGGSAGRRAPEGVKLAVRSPLPARIRLLRDGGTIRDAKGVRQLEETSAPPGVYRVEVYLPQLGRWAAQNPWIISNPILVGKN